MSRRRLTTDQKVGCGVLALYGFFILLGVAFWGTVIWGIIELISWLVTK